METFFEILKYTIPAVVVLLTAIAVLRIMLSDKDNRRSFKLKKQSDNQFTIIRLRAYERIVLFLERTQPPSLLLRQENMANQTCFMLQTELLRQIREEFEHNISQQIYISTEAWALVCNAKESLLKLVNLSAAQFSAEENALKMAEFMIKTFSQSENTPSQSAIDFLKKELKLNF